LGIFLFLIAGLVVAPLFIDLDKYKNDFSLVIKNFTGADPVIEGNVRVTLLPFPTVTISRISVPNIEGASNTSIFVADEVEARFTFSSLIKGKFDPSSLTLIHPRLELEKMNNGDKNWVKIYNNRDNTKIDKEHDVALNIIVKNGVIVYRSADLKTTVDNISSNIKIDSVNGPIDLKGSFLLGGTVLNFVAGIGALKENSTANFNLVSDSFELDMKGNYRPGSNFDINGSSSLNIKDLNKFVDSFFADEPLLDKIKSSESLEVKGDFLVSNDITSFNKIKIDSKSIKGKGGVDILYNSTGYNGVQWDINLNIEQINTDSLRAQNDAQKKASVEAIDYYTAGSDSFNMATYHFDLPTNFSALIALSVGEVIYNNDKVSNILIDTDVFNGKAIIHSFSADLPGKSKIELIGNVDNNGERPLLLGKIRAYGDNLRKVLVWLAPSYGFIPEDELKEFLFSCDLNITPRKMAISNIYGSFDRSLLSGSLFIRPTDAVPSIKADIKLDRFDFDKYNATKQVDHYFQEFFANAKDKDIDTSWLKLFSYRLALSANGDDIVYNKNNIKNISISTGIIKGVMNVQNILFDSDMAKFQGKVGVNFSKEIPEINADITSKSFDTAAFIVNNDSSKEIQDDKTTDTKEQAASIWSKKEFNLMGISRFSGTFNLVCDLFKHKNISVKDIALKGGLAKDVFTIDEFKSTWGEKGVVNVKGSVGVSQEAPSIGLSIAISAFDIHDLLQILGSKNNAKGSIYAGAVIKTFGLSPFEWVKEFKGTSKVAMRDVEIEGIDIPMIIEQSARLYSVIDMNTVVKTAQNSGKTKFIAIDGKIIADKSILQAKDIQIATDRSRGALVGNASLHNFKVKGLAKVNYIPEFGKKVSLNFDIDGALPDDVSYKLDSSNLEQYITSKASK